VAEDRATAGTSPETGTGPEEESPVAARAEAWRAPHPAMGAAPRDNWGQQPRSTPRRPRPRPDWLGMLGLHLGLPVAGAGLVALLSWLGRQHAAESGWVLILIGGVWLSLQVGQLASPRAPRPVPRRRHDLSDRLRANLAIPNNAPAVDMLSTLWR